MDDCHVPAKSKDIAYNPTRELADNCGEKKVCSIGTIAGD